MKTEIPLFIFLLLIIGMEAGCIDNTSSDNINVIVTIVPQKEMVESIGERYITVTLLVPDGQNPHSYEPTPSQMIKVAQAKAYFLVGSGIEFEVVHMDTILEQNSDLQVFDCSENITILSFDEHYGQEEHHEDEEKKLDHEERDENDHNHEGTDPHVWMSPLNYKKMIEVVYKGLITIDPDHQDEYYQNYKDYIAEIDLLHTNISNMLIPYKGRSFLVYHPAWGYFGDAYQLHQIAIEDKGKQPGPVGVSAIIQQALNQSINVIFVSPDFDTTSAKVIAKEINGTVVYADILMNDYKDSLQSLTSEIVTGFNS